jgi:glycosyltransferase involved in cell wall biosynthesis
MASFSVIVTAHNNAAVLRRTLQSVEDALAYHQTRMGTVATDGEVVVVDDGSTDATPEVLRDFTAGKGHYRLVRREQSSNPSCARNTGVNASTGDLLLFLDGDDLYLPDHVHCCVKAMEDPARAFVKTGVRLADPVHPDWHERIETSLVINLCVRRHCHFAVGGFPDYHLFLREGDTVRHVIDVFHHMEDQYYNTLVCALFRGGRALAQTVQYVRYPGNSYDRQYEKFCRPVGEYQETLTLEHQFRLRLAEAIAGHQRAKVRAGRPARPGGKAGGQAGPARGGS